MNLHDNVLIVGAGPTGLVLALWLTAQGVKVRIVDKTRAPATTSRALAVQARTLELYRQLDLTDAVLAAGHRNPAINLWTSGAKRATLRFGTAGQSLTRYPFVLIYPQDRHERLLIARLQALGIAVERQTECLGFEAHDDHVVVQLRTADGREQCCTAAYVAGCDGARSIVRHQMGTAFPGGTYGKFFYVADVQARGPAANGDINIALDNADFVAWLAYNDQGQGRLIGVLDDDDGADRAETLTFDDVAHRAIARIGLEVVKVHWFSTYRVHHRVTDHYRQGRAFLVGDAAHIHSPAGGQGMNTGIGDAINLAWKIAAVLRHGAPDTLLDSYEAERRAFALRLVETTDRVFQFITAEGAFADFVRTRIAPIVAPLAYGIDDVREYLFRLLSQTLISYHDSPISEGQAGEVRGGDRLPWVREDDNYGPLSAMAWQVHVYGAAREELAAWCAVQGIALQPFEFGPPHAAVGLQRDAAYLLRPDGHVGCADPYGGPARLESYLRRCLRQAGAA
ncbi:FAD-dependent monooxygenase [Acidovorax sp. CCYZU-2555]|uniref:FAD-dependent monooxygenase n=1 Tax=Acidovorax sp. CCYZU-2555 TaxID=2835042 RepID=UPI001BCD91C6|nr:FAD-dependent monooxygenase [Acidovorax sp. CCYZU-2555]MBS7776631.1 FAD-dependent monooxygenase [Acidovorax sp. CCYZU-2555]